ncbi:MAG: hypothetical protein HGA24_08710, partial [Candidatus Aminicenantes bacterium]|nr:hypothetical protein [Candidatus Aminicenantes bacterium]
LRYVVAPHRGPDTVTAKRLGLEAVSPLLPIAAGSASSAPRFPLTVDSPAFVAMSLRPSADGRAFILRLLNASDRPEALRLSGTAFDRRRVFLSDVDGTEGARLSAPLEVPAFGILTLRISR